MNPEGERNEEVEQNLSDSPQIIIDLAEIEGLSFDSGSEAANYLQKWALENSFTLNKEVKSYAVYMKCNHCGKPRQNNEKQNKRLTSSIKTGTSFS